MYKNQLTKTFNLPYSKTSVEITEGDGYGDRLFTQKGKRTFEVIPDYIALVVNKLGDIVKPSRDQILDLVVPDQEWISIENYKLNYGDILRLNNLCPRCGDPIVTVQDLSKLEIIPAPKDPLVRFTLTRTGLKAAVGFLTGHQEQLLLSLEASGNSDPNQADFLALRELDGKPPTYEDVINLPQRDHMDIREARAKLICEIGRAHV